MQTNLLKYILLIVDGLETHLKTSNNEALGLLLFSLTDSSGLTGNISDRNLLGCNNTQFLFCGDCTKLYLQHQTERCL